ncbi:MAG: hypothetical protein QM778_16070 [Myxococcales bacterium]
MTRDKKTAVLWFCLAVTWIAPVVAQAPASEAAERALEQGAFDEAARLAADSVAQGGLTRSELASLYRALGIAKAQLGAGEEAQGAFVRALAVDPSLKLAPSEAVRVRSLFMEARGFWSQHPQPFAVSAELAPDGKTLSLSFDDPAQLASRVIVRARFETQPSFVEQVLEPSARMQIPLAAAESGALLYTVAVLDENANRIWENGTDVQPARLEPPTPKPTAVAAASLPAPSSASGARAYYWGAGTMLLLGAASVGVAGYANFERQEMARAWNSGSCDGSGTSRGSVCHHERERMENFERLAIGFYSLGGAALITGLIVALVAPSRTPPAKEVRTARSWACQAGPGTLGLGCAAAF